MGVVADAQEGKSYKHASENVLAEAGMQMRAAIVQSRCRCAGGKMSLEETREALRRLDEGEEALCEHDRECMLARIRMYRLLKYLTGRPSRRRRGVPGLLPRHARGRTLVNSAIVAA